MLSCCRGSSHAIAIDVGNTSTKAAYLTSDTRPREVFLLGDPRGRWGDFETWAAEGLRQVTPLPLGVPLLVSAPGIVNPRTGMVIRYSSVIEWRERPLAKSLMTTTGATCVHLMNDGVAHLLAALEEIGGAPLVALSLGSAVGCGATRGDGSVAESDIGELHLPPGDGDTETKIGRAYGARGLSSLQAMQGYEAGAVSYGRRLAHLIKFAAQRFGSNVVVLSGGIVENWRKEILDGISREGVGDVDVKISPFGRAAAMVGLWAYAYGREREDNVRCGAPIDR